MKIVFKTTPVRMPTIIDSGSEKPRNAHAEVSFNAVLEARRTTARYGR